MKKSRIELIKHRRRRHPEAVQKSKEASNQTNYGQSAAEYDETLHKQKDRCAICGRKSKNLALSQDHTHAIVQTKIIVEKLGKWFHAYNLEYRYGYVSRSRKKAKREVLLRLRRRSRRGILCWHCNSGLRKWLDKPHHLHRAAKYLEHWQREQDWNNTEKKRLT